MPEAQIRARSWLFTPGNRFERFGNAAAAGADVLIIDLEDSVAAAEKSAARSAALDYLARDSGGIGQALRLNALDSRAGVADLNALLDAGAQPDYLILPKTESAAHVRIVARLLAESGKRARLVALVESANGLAEVSAIAAATPRLAALMFGAADMAADLDADGSWNSLLFARSRLVAACAAAGIAAIDAPYFDLRDSAGLKSEIGAAVALGFRAKAAVHPAQIAAINAALTPGPAAVEKARAVLAASAAGVGVVDGCMVDEAMARRARAVVRAAGIPGGGDKSPT